MTNTILLSIGGVIFLVATTATFLVLMLNADARQRETSDVYNNANSPPIDLRPSSPTGVFHRD